MKLLLIQGANMEYLGRRQPELYGTTTAKELDSILRRFPTSLLIVGCALSLSLLIGVPLGILAATRPGSRVDAVVTSIASLGVALKQKIAESARSGDR